MHYMFDTTIVIHKGIMVRLLSDGVNELVYICNQRGGRFRLGSCLFGI
jgi:hypothetical protein